MAKAEHQVQFNPFPGLRPFESRQHHLFFGREIPVGESIRRLERNRFLAVLGPSGSGKSSLLRAGLIPRLREGGVAGAGSAWHVALFRPGGDPLGNLQEALRAEGALGTDAGGDLRSGLAGVAERAGVGRKDNLLVVVDQFEELFRHDSSVGPDAEAGGAFVRLLLEAAEQRSVSIYVLLSMRADFLGACTLFPGLPEAINTGQYLIPRMNREELRAAIEKPIGVANAAIEPGLVERLLEDLADDQDQLPIMQHALMRTWDYWTQHHTDGEPIGEPHYEAIGTISEALSLHAEEVYEELPDEAARRIAEVMFKCLTDRSASSAGTRRPTPFREVCEVAGAGAEAVGGVVEYFRRAGRWFIAPYPEVPLSEDVVLDLVHESLMRVWKRLAEWVGEEAESAQFYMRLANTAALYQEGRSGLYQGPDLELALSWQQQQQPTLAWARRYGPAFERALTFLEHSRKQRDFEIATREERQRRQLKRARRFAILGGAASLVFLLFLLFTLNLFFTAEASRKEAIAQREVADKERRNAEAQREVADKERQNAEVQRKDAVQQREVAEEERKNAEAQRQIAVQQREVAEKERQNAEVQRKDAVQQREVAEKERKNAEAQRQIAVRQKQNADRLRLLSVARSMSIQSSKVQKNGQVELGALLALQAYRFNTRDGGPSLDPDIYQALRLAAGSLVKNSHDVLRGHEDGVRAVVFEPNGRRLVSASDDGSIRLWDLDGSGSGGRVLARGQQGVRSLAMTADGRRLAAGGADGSVRTWRLDRPGTPPVDLTEKGSPPSVVSSLAFDPSGRQLACGRLDGSVRVWGLEKPGTPPVVFDEHAGRIHTVAFSPDGRTLAFGSESGRLFFRDKAKPKAVPRMFSDPTGSLLSLAFSPDGRLLAVGTGQGQILVWDLKTPNRAPEQLIGHTAGVTALSFSPDSRLLASSSLDRSVRIWDPRNPNVESIRIEQDAWVWTVAFSPDGDRLATGAADRSIRIWPTRTDLLSEQVCKKLTRNMSSAEWKKFVGADIPYEKTCPDLPSRAPAD